MSCMNRSFQIDIATVQISTLYGGNECRILFDSSSLIIQFNRFAIIDVQRYIDSFAVLFSGSVSRRLSRLNLCSTVARHNPLPLFLPQGLFRGYIQPDLKFRQNEDRSSATGVSRTQTDHRCRSNESCHYLGGLCRMCGNMAGQLRWAICCTRLLEWDTRDSRSRL